MKPLHVQVAEAIGWTEIEGPLSSILRDSGMRYDGWPPGALPIVGAPRPRTDIPRYDTDWSATGPLIEPHEIAIEESGCGYTKDERWLARGDYYAEDPADREYGGRWSTALARGATPLIAVCRLILALKAAGKL